MAKRVERRCLVCDGAYAPRTDHAKYCSHACAYQARKGIPSWNAGQGRGWTDKRGYRWVYIIKNGKRRAIRENRYIMQQHLGRQLLPNEVVHHKNGDKADNRIGNLELQTVDEHTIAHSVGRTHPESSKRALEVFANYRQENRRLQELNTDLLAACETAVAALPQFRDCAGPCDHEVGICNCDISRAISMLKRAIGKAAKGGE